MVLTKSFKPCSLSLPPQIHIVSYPPPNTKLFRHLKRKFLGIIDFLTKKSKDSPQQTKQKKASVLWINWLNAINFFDSVLVSKWNVDPNNSNNLFSRTLLIFINTTKFSTTKFPPPKCCIIRCQAKIGWFSASASESFMILCQKFYWLIW